MSSSISHTKASACKFNVKSSHSLGWFGNMPRAVLEVYPGLACEPSSSELFETVKLFQLENGLQSDGKLGRGTWSTILKNFNHISNEAPF